MAGIVLPRDRWSRPGLSLIAKALGAADDMIRLVGGVVRDGLAGLDVKDVDLATRHKPEQVIKLLASAGIKTVPTGIAHGTVSAVLDWGTVEITTLRQDVTTDGRRATIAFSDDWQEDAARRDFTINALYADMITGEVHDYFDGVADLEAGIVRFIGEPLQRIAEDHLRIMRFFRFHARFGRSTPDQAALLACAARANDLMALSRERIADELLKLLALPNPVGAVELMLDHAILAPVLPEIERGSAQDLARLCKREGASAVQPDPLRRFSALLPTNLPIVIDIGARLKLSNKARQRLEAVAERSDTDADQPRALAYWEGLEVATDRLLLGEGDVAPLRGWMPPKFPLTGKHLISQGVPPGPKVSALLKDVERKWVAEGFPDQNRLQSLVAETIAKDR
jgi:poly(A) polymerase